MKIRTCSRKEKALTFNAKELGISGHKVGDKYNLIDEDGFTYVTYVNRKDCSTLYCPNKQVPYGFKKRAKVSKPIPINIVSIKKVK